MFAFVISQIFLWLLQLFEINHFYDSYSILDWSRNKTKTLRLDRNILAWWLFWDNNLSTSCFFFFSWFCIFHTLVFHMHFLEYFFHLIISLKKPHNYLLDDSHDFVFDTIQQYFSKFTSRKAGENIHDFDSYTHLEMASVLQLLQSSWYVMCQCYFTCLRPV